MRPFLYLLNSLLFSLLLASHIIFLPTSASAQSVKLSSGGICHCPGGSYYNKTSAANTYPTLQACLATGAREPKKGQGNCSAASSSSYASSPAPNTPVAPVQNNRAPASYNRDYFGGWKDTDRDCHDTRAEILMSLSTGPYAFRSNGCTVDRGRWLDPYTGRIFTQAGDLDIDHMVPLAWAWDKGAWSWDQATREQFANDPVNLFAVEASANRQKGAKGPLDWLPPDTAYQCEYVTRFERIRLTYKLTLSAAEQSASDAQRSQLCR